MTKWATGIWKFHSRSPRKTVENHEAGNGKSRNVQKRSSQNGPNQDASEMRKSPPTSMPEDAQDFGKEEVTEGDKCEQK